MSKHPIAVIAMVFIFAPLSCTGPFEPSDRRPDPVEQDRSAGGKADGFDWNQDGQGEFSITAAANTIVVLGTIPDGITDLQIQARATADMDLQLIDADDTKVVHYLQGVVQGQTESTAVYKDLQITWSGSDGIDDQPGNEDLTISGTLPSPMTLKLYAVQDCQVTVSYSWTVPSTYKPFAQRLSELAQTYPQQVIVATKQGKPAIFVDTSALDTDAKIEAFFAALYQMIGTNTVMAWNPAGENFFHLWTPDSTLLEERFRHKAMTVYGSPSYWDASMGNLDDEYGGDEDDEYCYEGCDEGCYEDCYEECDEDEDTYDCQCFQDCRDECLENCGTADVDAERAVALIVLSNAHVTLLNDYLAAITDDPETNLGPSEYNGGVPPYLSGDPDGKHNCTSWFSEWLNRKVSPQFPVYYNPAALLKAYTQGGYSGVLADRFRALLVFNHGNPPASGDTVAKNFPLDFGH